MGGGEVGGMCGDVNIKKTLLTGTPSSWAHRQKIRCMVLDPHSVSLFHFHMSPQAVVVPSLPPWMKEFVPVHNANKKSNKQTPA